MASTNTTDSLLESAIWGDEAAFQRLYDRFAKKLERYVSGRLQPRGAAHTEPEDIVQEVFAEVFTHITRFHPRGRGTFYRLLVTIARRRMIDLNRRLSARPEGNLAPEASASAASGVSEFLESKRTGPLTQLLRSEERDLCRQAFEELPESAREILWLRLVEERSAREISTLTGKSVGAVWVWFHRALKAWYEKFNALRAK